ncbi:MAG: replicative DNA helicase [Acholeplasmataceae bacterium]|nr:replicative DNA helicase [Acholeplasmataceae bacterium]
MVNSRIMPHNVDAEKSVLGAIFLSPGVLASVADKLSVDDFFELKNKRVYFALLRLLEKAEKIDFTTISAELASLKSMDQVGVDYLSELVDFTPTLANLESYIEIVKDYSLKRAMISVSGEIYAEGFNPAIDATDYVDQAEEKIFQLIRRRRAGEFLTIDEILREVRKKAEIKRSEGDVTGLNTGFGRLNYLTSGFQNEELIILAARPSVGKSALAMNLAIQAAKNNSDGHAGVAFFSLEMSNEQLVSRMLSYESLVDNRLIRNGTLTPNDWQDINAATQVLNSLNLYFDDTATVQVKDIRAKCRKLKQNGRLDFVVVDYLQLIQEAQARGTRQENVAEISRGLKLMARELQIPVLALSQLSRSVDREKRTPVLADLRESGSIEQDADIVMFMYEPEDETGQSTDNIEILLAKNRQGATGRFMLRFQKNFSRFYPLVEREDE